MIHEPANSDAYEITTKMILDRLQICDRQLRRHVQYNNIPRGKRRAGRRGLLWTAAQANRLLKRLGIEGKRFNEVEI